MIARLGIVLTSVVALGAGAAQADIQLDFNDRGFSQISPTLAGWEGFALGPAGQTNVNLTAPVTRSYGEVDVTVSRIVLGAGTQVLRDNNYDPGPPNTGSFTQANLMRDSINVDNTATGEGINILVEGLTPNAQYDGRIWSYDDAHYNLNTRNSFAADWSANGTQFADNVSLSKPRPTSNLDHSYAFSTTSNALGEIVIQGVRDVTSIGNPVLINGLQLTLVPEPASVMLIGLGAACLLTRRTRS